MKSVKILLISIITIFLSSLAHAELNINRVITSVEGSGKWITVRTSFYNVDSDNVTEIFRMGIDGDLENGNFHALRFDERSFRIPKEYSFESQPGRFFFADFSVNSGAFRNLYNYLDTKNQANIEAACNYMNNNKVIDKILKTKSINNAHGPFLANQKTKKSLSDLLDLCVKTSAKVYVVDVQNYLSALGYNVGKIDGKWGRKSELGLAKFQTDRGLEVKTAVSSNLLRIMKADVIDKEIKFSTLSTKPQYFDKDGKLVGKYSKKISIAQKLKNRKTINPFLSFYTDQFTSKKYGLFFTAEPPKSTNSLMLSVVQWMYYFPDAPWDYIPGIEEFTTKKNWNHSDEYGKTLAVAYRSPGFSNFIANGALKKTTEFQSDGVWLDWWHNWHPATGYSNAQVEQARIKIVKAIRESLGDEKIIMANPAINEDKATASELSGVFLELVKSESQRKSVYSTQQLRNIQQLILFYEENLRYPKIIAIDGWRATSVSDNDQIAAWKKDRNSTANRQMAKLITAMSVVLPTNGYIMYSDNNHDSLITEHGHEYYDFYSFDIGKPTSGYNKVKSGVGYKEHDKGFIAYNITGSSKKFKRKNGQEHTIEAKSGLFCKDVGAKTECLSNN